MKPGLRDRMPRPCPSSGPHARRCGHFSRTRTTPLATKCGPRTHETNQPAFPVMPLRLGLRLLARFRRPERRSGRSLAGTRSRPPGWPRAGRRLRGGSGAFCAPVVGPRRFHPPPAPSRWPTARPAGGHVSTARPIGAARGAGGGINPLAEAISWLVVGASRASHPGVEVTTNVVLITAMNESQEAGPAVPPSTSELAAMVDQFRPSPARYGHGSNGGDSARFGRALPAGTAAGGAGDGRAAARAPV